MAYCEVPDTTEIHIRKAGDMKGTYLLIDYHDGMPDSCNISYANEKDGIVNHDFGQTRAEVNSLRDVEGWKLVKVLKKRWFDIKDPMGEGEEPLPSQLGRLYLEKEYQ